MSKQTSTAVASVPTVQQSSAVGLAAVSDFYRKISDPVQAVLAMGKMLYQSGAFGCNNEAQGQTLAWLMAVGGRDPFVITRKYHVANGKLLERADWMAGTFKQHGGKIEILQRDAEAARAKMTYQGQSMTFSYTWEEAEQEPAPWSYKDGVKKLKDNWATPRARMQMLWARVMSDGVRTLAPELIHGEYTAADFGLDAGYNDAVATELVDGDSDVIDIESSVAPPIAKQEKPKKAAAEKATPEKKQTAPKEKEPEAAESTPIVDSAKADTSEVTLITNAQIKRIEELYGTGCVTIQKWGNLLAKAKVREVRELTRAKADAIINYLEAQVQQKEMARHAESQFGGDGGAAASGTDSVSQWAKDSATGKK